MHPKFDATWLLVRSADSHWEKKGSLLLSLVLAAFGTMDSSLIFSPQVSVSLFGWCLACTEEQNKAKANRASLYPCTAAFKQEVCLTCSFSHCGLFVCTSLTPLPPPNTHTPSISVCGLKVIEAWVIQETYSASSLQKPDLARLNHRYL